MFNIKYRIVDDLDDLKNTNIADFDYEIGGILGFFSMTIGHYVEGFCDESYNAEEGWYYLDMWFTYIASMLKSLEIGEPFACQEPEGINRIIKANKIGHNVIFNIVDKNSEHNNSFSTPKAENIMIEYDIVKQEIIKAIKSFKNDILELNAILLETKTFNFLNDF